MTYSDLDDTWPPPDETAMSTVTPRRCRRHQWQLVTEKSALYESADAEPITKAETYWQCSQCGRRRDDARSRRGFRARKRGNHLQAAVAKAAGIANIGALGLPEDAGGSRDWLVLQVKSGLGYPRTLDRWLRALSTTADQLRAVVYVETPGPGRKAKRLIVCDYDEFLEWFGPREAAPIYESAHDHDDEEAKP